jgi:uncharacterized protein (TIGR03435 family)
MQTYHAEGATLRSLMTIAYSVTDRQIAGGPSWIGTDRFDIDAKAAHSRTADELHLMLGRLLEERFHLQIKHEKREGNVYNLTVYKGAPKLPVHDPEDKDHPPIGGRPARAADGSMCPTIEGHNVAMEYFAFFLSRGLDRKVLDKTELHAHYDVTLRYLPDGLRLRGPEGDGPTISSDCVDIFAALPKQLGLKLEPGKGPVDFLVIEHVEKPTEN